MNPDESTAVCPSCGKELPGYTDELCYECLTSQLADANAENARLREACHYALDLLESLDAAQVTEIENRGEDIKYDLLHTALRRTYKRKGRIEMNSYHTVKSEAYGTRTHYIMEKTAVESDKQGITITMSCDDMDGPEDEQKIFIPQASVLAFIAGIARTDVGEDELK